MLSPALQADVDRLWVSCVSCPLAEREEVWDRGLITLRALTGPDFEGEGMADALQDAGHRLGIFQANALTLRILESIKGRLPSVPLAVLGPATKPMD